MAKTSRELLADLGQCKRRIAQFHRAIVHTSKVLHSLDQQRHNDQLSEDDRKSVEVQYQEEKRRMQKLRDGMTKELKKQKKIEGQVSKLVDKGQ